MYQRESNVHVYGNQHHPTTKFHLKAGLAGFPKYESHTVQRGTYTIKRTIATCQPTTFTSLAERVSLLSWIPRGATESCTISQMTTRGIRMHTKIKRAADLARAGTMNVVLSHSDRQSPKAQFMRAGRSSRYFGEGTVMIRRRRRKRRRRRDGHELHPSLTDRLLQCHHPSPRRPRSTMRRKAIKWKNDARDFATQRTVTFLFKRHEM